MSDQFALPLETPAVKGDPAATPNPSNSVRRRLPALHRPETRPIYADQPEVGFYMVKFARKAVEVPARIYIADHEPGEPDNKRDRWPLEIILGEICGKPADAFDVWLWHRRRLTEAEFHYQLADFLHAQEWRPGDPKANPRQPIDLASAPPVYQRKA